MDMQQLTKIMLAWELFEDEVPQVHIASKLDVNRDTVRLWIKAIKEVGLLEYLEDYTNAKKGHRASRKIDGLLKARIYKLREDYRD